MTEPKNTERVHGRDFVYMKKDDEVKEVNATVDEMTKHMVAGYYQVDPPEDTN